MISLLFVYFLHSPPSLTSHTCFHNGSWPACVAGEAQEGLESPVYFALAGSRTQTPPRPGGYLARKQILTLSPDILHLHSPAIPQTPRILSQCRNPILPDPPLADLLRPQRIQEQLQQADQRPLRHRPARRRSGLALLFLPGDRLAGDWNSLRPLWQTHRPPLVHDGQHRFCRSVVRGNGFQDILG